MACLEMYNQKNTDKKSAAASSPPPMSPRISFSNDFTDHPSQYSHSNPHHHHQVRAAAAAYREAPVSSDFQFPVRKHSMMSADELFSKGRLLPSKESCCSSNSQKTMAAPATTLRDELQNENEGSFSIMRPPSNKNPTSWRGLLGIRSKKSERAVEKRADAYYSNNHNHDGDDDDDVQCSKKSQDFVD
ncbi:hypothetical protein OROGR_007870 [Orobanche gracilis]